MKFIEAAARTRPKFQGSGPPKLPLTQTRRAFTRRVRLRAHNIFLSSWTGVGKVMERARRFQLSVRFLNERPGRGVFDRETAPDIRIDNDDDDVKFGSDDYGARLRMSYSRHRATYATLFSFFLRSFIFRAGHAASPCKPRQKDSDFIFIGNEKAHKNVSETRRPARAAFVYRRPDPIYIECIFT